MVLFIGFGLVIAALAFITSAWVGAALLAVLGIGDGYVAVTLMTTVQRVTPPAMLGRVMSLLMLAMLGVQPISTAVSGAVIGLGADVLFVGCGAGVLAIAVRRLGVPALLVAGGAGGAAARLPPRAPPDAR